jgi:cytochrome c
MQFHSKNLKMPVISVGSLAAIVLTVACTQFPQQAQAADPMMSGPMDNMKRIMMMPEADRMQYVQNSTKDSLAHGAELFQDTKLGTNGQSCNSCHINGGTTGGKVEMMPGMKMPIPDLHASAATYPKFKVPNDAVITLTEMNNNCIVMFQMGQPLPLDSQESRDLAAYVTSLK